MWGGAEGIGTPSTSFLRGLSLATTLAMAIRDVLQTQLLSQIGNVNLQAYCCGPRLT